VAVKLVDLTQAIEVVQWDGTQDLEVTAVTADSRAAGPDTLFVAVKGTTADGHRLLPTALERGCRAAVVSVEAAATLDPALRARFAALVRVADTRFAPALLARTLAGAPDAQLFTAGVTGTNGKTTVSFLLQSVLGRLRGPCGLLGTIRYQAGDLQEPAPLTTPAGPELYRWLGLMVQEGCRSVAMELSSHALDQGRAAGLRLDVAVMTNLGRDHLDYHRDLAAYLAAKAGIFDHLDPDGGAAVINADDPAFSDLVDGLSEPILFSATGRPCGKRIPDLTVTDSRLDRSGSRVDFTWRGRPLTVKSPLVGRYNVENLTATLAAVLGAGFDPDRAVAALESLEQVPGRMERFVLPSGGLAVVDYAHTAEAVAAVLRACAELTSRRILVVFGCGGDRDRGKRPLMGRAAADLADAVWVTSDNPRTEDPEAIIAEVLAGIDGVPAPRARSRVVIPDRAAAIADALGATGDQDVVVIAGKGHEDYQLVGDQVLPLDDRRIVREWIAAQGGGA